MPSERITGIPPGYQKGRPRILSPYTKRGKRCTQDYALCNVVLPNDPSQKRYLNVTKPHFSATDTHPLGLAVVAAMTASAAHRWSVAPRLWCSLRIARERSARSVGAIKRMSLRASSPSLP